MIPWPLLLLCLAPFSSVHAQITVYSQIPLGQTATETAPDPAVTTLAAYNDTLLPAPGIPDPAPPTQFTLELQADAGAVEGLSIPHQGGSLWGFSIEMSVLTQVLGRNSSHLNPPFLNLMSNIVERAGSIGIRCGGNTQERAELVDFIDDGGSGRSLGKEQIDTLATTRTPAVTYTVDFLYMLSNISSLLPEVGWYLGIPFNQTDPFRLEIAELSQSILGEHLIGLQAGNEPDFYAGNGIRQPEYGPQDYFNEVGWLIGALDSNENIPVKNNLLAPSTAGSDPFGGQWTPEMVFDTGLLDAYGDRISVITVEHYPDNNCAAQFGADALAKIPELIFPDFLNHTSPQLLVAPFLGASGVAQSLGKPFIMFETNTASCGGFPGISDSFGAALWALDYGLQLAHSNFTHGMLHVGGQNNYYNPFTAPPTNQSSFNEWTIGAVYYSTLVAAEVFGRSENAQIIDLNGNEGNIFTPQYAVYDDGRLDKVALFNYVTDPTGAQDYTATLHINGEGAPSEVYVKYLTSESVSNKDDIRWAGQTFGTKFTVDGRLKDDMDIVTVPCDQEAAVCNIGVPAPGFALVFFNRDRQEESSPNAIPTFATTAHTRVRNTATVDPAVLETSNGMSGSVREQNLGSTSPGSSAVRIGEGVVMGVVVSCALVLGTLNVWRTVRI